MNIASHPSVQAARTRRIVGDLKAEHENTRARVRRSLWNLVPFGVLFVLAGVGLVFLATTCSSVILAVGFVVWGLSLVVIGLSILYDVFVEWLHGVARKNEIRREMSLLVR